MTAKGSHASTTEAQAPAADSPGREPDHGASR
jgi:hypothetical protein